VEEGLSKMACIRDELSEWIREGNVKNRRKGRTEVEEVHAANVFNVVVASLDEEV
jgi:hypothetical protein